MVDRIKALLQERQLSTTQFADLVGVARPIISHVLSGRNKPSLEVVQRILAAFPDLSMAWLLNGTGPMLAAGPAPAAVAALEATTVPAAATAASNNALKSAQTPVKEAVFIDSSADLAPQAAAPASEASPPTPPVAVYNVPPAATAMPLLPAAAPRPLMQPRQRFAPGFAPAAANAPGQPLPVAPASPVLGAIPVPPAPPFYSLALVAPAPVAEPLATTSIDPLPATATAVAAAVPGKAIRRIVIFYQDGSFSDFAPE